VIRASHRLPESARGTTAITELVREAMAAASTQLARTSLKDLVERLEASQGTLVPAGERESEYSDN
jgi:DNA-binding IscR family transcriptional regulator